MKLILSTLSAPNSVLITHDLPNGNKQVEKRIVIKGGANVVDRKTLDTPLGVVTELTDEDFDLVVKSEWYKRQNAAGFVRPVVSASEAEDPVKKGMAAKDRAAQKTDADYKAKGKMKVRTGKVEEDLED